MVLPSRILESESGSKVRGSGCRNPLLFHLLLGVEISCNFVVWDWLYPFSDGHTFPSAPQWWIWPQHPWSMFPCWHHIRPQPLPRCLASNENQTMNTRLELDCMWELGSIFVLAENVPPSVVRRKFWNKPLYIISNQVLGQLRWTTFWAIGRQRDDRRLPHGTIMGTPYTGIKDSEDLSVWLPKYAASTP